MDAVRVYLGSKRTYLVGFLQYLTLYGTCIAYVITTASCIRAILKSNCYHKEGHKAPCKYVDTLYLMLFGVVQIVMSFIPDLHNMAWVSVVAALMSFTYATIGLGLGITTVIENGRIMGSITGVAASNTLEAPPSENKTMKKASMIAIFITTFFYLCCGCFGYAAFGDQTPGNLLTGFGFYEPYWLIDFANACIVLHLIGGYQICCQPIYNAVDRWCQRKYPNSEFVNKFYRMKLPAFQVNLFRICFRTTYVVSTTGLGILFLYFNQVLGVLGAISFWPLAIYFPVEMYFVQKKIEAWSRKWIVLRIFGFVCFLVPLSQLGVGNGQPLTLTSSLSRARPRNPFTLTSSLPSLSVRHSQSLSISPRHALVLSLFSFAVNFLRATRFAFPNPSPVATAVAGVFRSSAPPPSLLKHSQRPRGPRVVSATAVAWSSALPLRLRWPLPSSSLVFASSAPRGHVAVMYLSRTFGRTLFAAAARSRTYASSAGTATAAGDKPRNPLEEFFEVDRDMESDKPIVYGRGWKASELRLKSWDDLHKLWYVLLKEKNMLMTQRQMLNSQNLRFPNPERIPKVRKSMCRIKQVLTERAIDEPDPRRSAEMKRMINAL
ncbi:hypothetical protein Ahy_A03g015245 isoform B [Arachis hypogaea]|uniref:Amino acid transporter transmembrane domain-containing protein n=2 Tax=Arachis TaxID=3817 RepID=A0A445DZZ6_ARAHY|nr:hypothetical protein Ahy_A03g015245 isoform B [Arachis hypogaea]